MTTGWTRSVMVASLVTVAVLLGQSLPVQAGHNPQQTQHCTYEIGLVGDWMGNMQEDPAGVTGDGRVNVAACTWEFPGAEGVWPMILDGFEVGGEYTLLQVTLIDDVFGNAVGGEICSDVNGDLVCGAGEEDEISDRFCGTSSVFEAAVDTDGDGHKDFGNYVAVWVNGVYQQAVACDPSTNPVGGTTGGVLNPSGGMFMALAG